MTRPITHVETNAQLRTLVRQTRVDLYFLARKVREGEQGIAPSNMLDLPALS